jgi:hypothetical protein
LGLASSLLFACESPEVDDPTQWTVDLHGADVFVSTPDETGCLAPTSERLARATTVEVLASDGTWYLLAEGFRLIRAANTLSEHRPDTLRPRLEAVVQKAGPRYVFGTDGCPVPSDTEWEAGQVVTRFAKAHDADFHGFALVNESLEMAPMRHTDGWDAPWQAGVQLYDGASDGALAGGGVLIDADTLLTTASTGVSDAFCFSRGPSSVWGDDDVHCTVADVVEHDAVDLAVVRLSEPLDGPFAPLRATALSAESPFYVQRFGGGNAREFGDSIVHSVGLNNADCDAWPYPSSFLSESPVTGPGDTGSPAYAGAELVGLMHGDACFPVTDEEGRQTFIHLPALLDFIDEVRADDP